MVCHFPWADQLSLSARLGGMRNRLIAHSGVNYREVDFFCTVTLRQKVQVHHVIGTVFLFHEITKEPQFLPPPPHDP